MKNKIILTRFLLTNLAFCAHTMRKEEQKKGGAMNTPKDAKRRPLNVTLPESLLREFKNVCQRRGAQYSATVESCLRAWIDLAVKAENSNLPPLVFKTMAEIQNSYPQPEFHPSTSARQVKTHRGTLTSTGYFG